MTIFQRIGPFADPMRGFPATEESQDQLRGTITVWAENPPNVEMGDYERLRTGDDWSASFNAVRDHVGRGGSIGAGKRTYEVDNLTLLPGQRLIGEGSLRTRLRAKAGAVRVIDLPADAGVPPDTLGRYPRLQGVWIDGRERAAEGSRIQAFNGTGGGTNQGAQFDDVRWYGCSICHRNAGTGAVPQAGQTDKATYYGCSMFDFGIGLQTDNNNSQQQLWIGGEISDGDLCIKLFGGGFHGIGMQFQRTAVGTGKILEFAGNSIADVILDDCISEGWLTGLDSGVGNFWPLVPVKFRGGVLQVHEPAGGDLATIDRGGSVCKLIAIGTELNGGPIRLRGVEAQFLDLGCRYNGTGGAAATVIESGVNAFWLRNLSPWRAIGAAGQPAFAGAWGNFGAGSELASFRRDAEGMVHLKGALGGGVIGTPAFTLPVGYRPLGYSRFAVSSNNAYGQVDISAAGVVTPQIGAGFIIDLEGILFSSTVARNL